MCADSDDRFRQLASEIRHEFAVQNRDRVLAGRARFDHAAVGATASPDAVDGTGEAQV
jgi:hypothetical protein